MTDRITPRRFHEASSGVCARFRAGVFGADVALVNVIGRLADAAGNEIKQGHQDPPRRAELFRNAPGSSGETGQIQVWARMSSVVAISANSPLMLVRATA